MQLAISIVLDDLATYALSSAPRRLLQGGRLWVIGPLTISFGLTIVGLALLWFESIAPYALVLGILAALIVGGWGLGLVVRTRAEPAWSWGLGSRATLGYAALATGGMAALTLGGMAASNELLSRSWQVRWCWTSCAERSWRDRDFRSQVHGRPRL